ncbi:transcriptional regulator [Caballeronia sp. DA-9]|uniref:transcriptional regulator n=1 Tax=Caballeronia sp. DA-9 TaxID=3436237 RepID=UPI003F668274
MKEHPVERAARIAGGYKALGDLLGVTKGAVHQWLDEKRHVPAVHCPKIETFTGVSRKDLRPDDWNKYWPELETPRIAKAA